MKNKILSYMKNTLIQQTTPFNTLMNEISSGIVSSMTFSVLINDSIVCYLKNIFNNIIVYANITSDPDEPIQETSVKYITTYRSLHKNVSFAVYKNAPIVLIHESAAANNDPYSEYKLVTFNNEFCIKQLKDMLRHAAIMYRLDYIDNSSESIYQFIRGSCRDFVVNNQKRDFDSVFIPKEQKDLLLDSIQHYIDRYDWYNKNKIPNHFGIMLYGEPGTGKTSIAAALATHFKCELTILTGDNIKCLPDAFRMNQISIKPLHRKMYRIILIEDIDCGFKNKRELISDNISVNSYDSIDTYDRYHHNNGVASLLNIFDGIGAPSNVIYIFTTNHRENLDPALIRPGRIDLAMEIGYVTRETFDDFCDFHYGRHSTEEFEIKPNMLFATLQVEVMKEKTLEEIVDIVKKENN